MDELAALEARAAGSPRVSFADRLGVGRVAVPEELVVSQPVTARGGPVPMTRDLARVLELPRRPQPTDAQLGALAEKWTAALRRPSSSARLWPVQAWALEEISRCGGLLGGIPVGGGKTLLGLLAPLVVPGCRRALLLIPASVRPQLAVELESYGRDWRLPNVEGGTRWEDGLPILKVAAYSTLSHEKNRTLITDFQPDLILGDEAHTLSGRSARTRRLRAWMTAHPSTRCAFWTGSIVSNSLRNYSPLAAMALK